MTPEDIIREVQENAAEWLEMSKNPAELTAGILAKRIIVLTDYIEYLEKRLNYVRTIKQRPRARQP